MTHAEMKAALRAANHTTSTTESNKAGALGILAARVQSYITTSYDEVNINGEDGLIDRFITGYDYQRQIAGKK